MATMRERYEKTKEIVLDDAVTFPEGLKHLYFWFRFEYAIIKRNKHHQNALKYQEKLNNNLDVFSFRKELTDI